MPTNAAALARARAAADYNFFPPLPRPPAVLPEVEETDTDKLQRLARAGRIVMPGLEGVPDAIARAQTARSASAGGRLPRVPRGQHFAIGLVSTGGGADAASVGPIPYPWRLVAALVTGGSPFSVAVTATPLDVTGFAGPAGGIALVEGAHRTDGVVPADYGGPPYFFLPTATRSYDWRGLSQVVPAGWWLTLWGFQAGPWTGLHLAASVEQAAGALDQTVYDAPIEDYGQAYRLSVPRPPARRAVEPLVPSSMRITSLGFSRVIPWDLLDPVLQREYLVNVANGKPTPGMQPV